MLGLLVRFSDELDCELKNRGIDDGVPFAHVDLLKVYWWGHPNRMGWLKMWGGQELVEWVIAFW